MEVKRNGQGRQKGYGRRNGKLGGTGRDVRRVMAGGREEDE